jgi:hypothetical protein
MNKPLTYIIKAKVEVGTLFSLGDILPYYDKSEDALKEEMSRLAKKGFVKRIGYGIYLLPKGKENEEDLKHAMFTFRYIKNSKEVYGFFYGQCFTMGLLNRPFDPDHLEIVSNKVTSGKKTIYQLGQRLTLRRPYVKVNKDNVAIVGLLTYLAYASKEDLNVNYSLLANYVREEHISAIEVSDMLPAFPAKSARTLLSSGLYKIMWHH